MELTPITPEMTPVAPAPADDGAPFIAERFRADASAEPEKTANWTLAGIFAIVAFILFAITLFVVLQDWSFLKNA